MNIPIDDSSSDKVITAAHDVAYHYTECSTGERHMDILTGFYAGVRYAVASLVKDMFREEIKDE